MSFGSTLESIPLPVLAHCLSYLLEDGDILSFEGASRACRSLRHAADLARAACHSLDLSVFRTHRLHRPSAPRADQLPMLRRTVPMALGRCPALRELRLSGSRLATDGMLARAAVSLTTLTRLDLQHCALVGENGLRAVLGGRWRLLYLSLANLSCGVPVPDDPRVAGVAVSGLRGLNLAWCGTSIVTGLISHYLPASLCQLSLHGARLNAEESLWALETVARACRSLGDLDVALLPLTERALRSVSRHHSLRLLVLTEHSYNLWPTGSWTAADVEELQRNLPALKIAYASA